jgi:1-acyl-sn-glycerol-3-phosphate acyltransferase
MSNLFLSIYYYFKTRKPFLYGMAILFFALCFYLAGKIRLEEDISEFMPSTPATERTNYVLRNISTSDKIIINLSLADTTVSNRQDYLIAYADTLVDLLKSDPGENYIRNIFYNLDDSRITETSEFILRNLPLYVKESDYQRLDSILNPAGIQSVLEQNKRDLVSPMGLVYKKFLIADPFHISARIFREMQLNSVDTIYSLYNGYIFSRDQKNLLIFLTSAYSVGETGRNKVLSDALDYHIKNIINRSKDKIAVTSFGASIVGVSNASQIKKDTWLAGSISVFLILLLLTVFFRSLRSLLFLIIPVVFGMAFSTAIMYLIKGTVSAIAIGAGSVILGIAINYSLHFLAHFKHSGSVEQTIKDLASPMIVGNITTVGAFLSLLYVSAEALRDFGLFSSFALVGTILFVLIFMPHIVEWASISSSHYPAIFDRISGIRFDKNKWVILVIILLTLFFGYFSKRLTFESDLNKISFMTSDQKKALTELSSFTNLAQKSLIHVSEGHDLNEALGNYETARVKIDSLARVHDINSVSGVGEMLASDSVQIQKIRRWNSFWESKKLMIKTMNEQSAGLGFKENTFSAFASSTKRECSVVSSGDLLKGADFVNPYIINKSGRTLIITLLYLNPGKEDDVKKVLGNQQGTFIFDRLSATKATLNILSGDFNFVLWFSSLLVLAFLTLSFGRFELSLMTFIPMLIGWLWILGLMAIFDLKFNIVNIILATFIFGLCDDYSIFIMEGSIQEHAYEHKVLNSYKLAVILSALTMFIGIGALITAKHPAMKSLGQVTIIGMVSVVVISYTILPFLYRTLTVKNGRKRIMPVTGRNILTSIYSFTAFLIGSLFHSIFGFILFRLTRSTDRKKFLYHRSLAFTAGFVVKRLPDVRTRVINTTGEDFTKPAIIICNHQSHIDLMLIMMLSPRIVVLTNEWVWNSPFYGSIVKYADFYPVINGIEGSVEHLSRLINKGYSIMIFPEGTRSEDCSISRFHRGAFFLAEKLNLDLLPVMIHGMGHVLPKTDFLLRKGAVTVEVLSRITRENTIYGESYLQRAKYVRMMYINQYQQMVSEIETPDYFADKLFHNYIYKGAAVSALVKADLNKHGNYSDIIKSLPETGNILVLGAGSGSFPLMLSMVKPALSIDAVEEDEDNLALAMNCGSCTNKLSYMKGSPLNFTIEKSYDAIVLVDCLSLSEYPEQKQILRKCVNHAPLVLISDIEYPLNSKIRIMLKGIEQKRLKFYTFSFLEQLSEGLSVNIIQKDNIFALSRRV